VVQVKKDSCPRMSRARLQDPRQSWCVSSELQQPNDLSQRLQTSGARAKRTNFAADPEANAGIRTFKTICERDVRCLSYQLSPKRPLKTPTRKKLKPGACVDILLSVVGPRAIRPREGEGDLHLPRAESSGPNPVLALLFLCMAGVSPASQNPFANRECYLLFSHLGHVSICTPQGSPLCKLK
jgi:hypothetical protein